MLRWIKKAWSPFKNFVDIIGVLQTLGAWKWIATEVAVLMGFLGVFWLQLALWEKMLLGLALTIGLEAFALFLVALWKTRYALTESSERVVVDTHIGRINPAQPPPQSPEKQFCLFPRTLEAVVESPLRVQQTGSLLVSISTGASSELEPILSIERYSTMTWGQLERSDCEVPFPLSIQQEYLPSSIELRLVTADLISADNIRPMNLKWNTRSRPVEFLVKPLAPGVHKAQVQLWAHRKWQGSVVIQSTATSESRAETAGADAGGLKMIASVEVKFKVVGYDQSIRQSYEQSQKYGESQGHGYGMGM